MKAFLTVAISILFFPLFGQSLGVSVSPVLFQVDSMSAMELNFQYYGKSLKFDTLFAAKEPDVRAAVEVTSLFKKNAEIVKFDRYKINIPIEDNQTEFLDTRSYVLSPGEYELEIEFVDHFNPESTHTHTETILVPEINLDSAGISGIKLLARLETFTGQEEDEAFLKNGVIMEPLPHQFYNRRLNTLSFYVELYRLGKLGLDNYILRTEIFSLKKGDWKEVLTTYQKLADPKETEPIAKKIDISRLASSTYKLTVSLIDGAKTDWLSRSVVFVQSNPEMDEVLKEKLLSGEVDNFFDGIDEEKLLYSLRALAMKLGGDDQQTVNNLIRKEDYASMRDFLFRYWINEDPIQPERAYKEFMRLIDAIDQKFYSAFRHGFETDRGMIYLRYGPPMRIISRENDQGAVPYEIWTYDRVDVNNQVDVKFVFYNPTLAGDEFQLLHSNARNEIRNPQWLGEIYNVGDQLDGSNPVDARGVQDNFQREAARIFNDN